MWDKYWKLYVHVDRQNRTSLQQNHKVVKGVRREKCRDLEEVLENRGGEGNTLLYRPLCLFVLGGTYKLLRKSRFQI